MSVVFHSLQEAVLVQFRSFVYLAILAATSGFFAQQNTPMAYALEPQERPAATAKQSNSHQLAGTVVDSSGAAIAGATIAVWSSDGIQQKPALSDKDGAFVLAGLAAGDYRIAVSSPDFETKELSVTVGLAEPRAYGEDRLRHR